MAKQEQGKEERKAGAVKNAHSSVFTSANTGFYEVTSFDHGEWRDLHKALGCDAMQGRPSYIQGFILDRKHIYVLSSRPMGRRTAWAIASRKRKLREPRCVFREMKHLVDVGGYFEEEK